MLILTIILAITLREKNPSQGPLPKVPLCWFYRPGKEKKKKFSARSSLFLIYVSTWIFPCSPRVSCCLAAWNLLRGQCTEWQRHDLNITNFMTFVLCSYHHENEIKKKLSTQTEPNLLSSVFYTWQRCHFGEVFFLFFLFHNSSLVFAACFTPTKGLCKIWFPWRVPMSIFFFFLDFWISCQQPCLIIQKTLSKSLDLNSCQSRYCQHVRIEHVKTTCLALCLQPPAKTLGFWPPATLTDCWTSHIFGRPFFCPLWHHQGVSLQIA